jgi:hypothetical protein
MEYVRSFVAESRIDEETFDLSDVSELVQRTGYFGSYNVAFDPYLRRISGAEAAAEKGGPWFECVLCREGYSLTLPFRTCTLT